MKQILCTALFIFLLAACATQNVQTRKSPAGTKKPFIERSVILFPKQSEDFTLAKEYTYPQSYLGIQLTYFAESFPDARIDVYVYPHGSGSVAHALGDAMKEVHNDIRQAQAQGLYSGVKFGDIKNTTLELDPGKKMDNGLEVPAVELPGREFPLTYVIDGTPYRSAAFVFYRYMYYIKFRISAPAVSPDDPSVIGKKLTDEIARNIKIVSEGACSMPLTVNEVATLPAGQPGADDPVSADGHILLVQKGTGEKQLAQLMLIAAFRIGAEGCPPDGIDDKPIKPQPGEGVEWLHFTTADWGGESP